MCTFALCFLLLCVLCGLVKPSVGCFRCFVNLKETSELCAGYKTTMFNLNTVDECFKTLDRLFNDNPKVIEAGRVGMDSFGNTCTISCRVVKKKKKIPSGQNEG